MRGINKVILLGNLYTDPESSLTPDDKPITTFTLATGRSFLDEKGRREEEVEHHKIVTGGRLAEICAQFLGKGRSIYVEGRLSTRQWTDKEGNAHSTTEIIVDTLQLLNATGARSERFDSDPA